MTFIDFFEYCRNNAYLMNQRKGQFAMNALFHLRRDIYDKLMKSYEHEIDPFYDDSHLPAFYDFVVENWRKDNA